MRYLDAVTRFDDRRSMHPAHFPQEARLMPLLRASAASCRHYQTSYQVPACAESVLRGLPSVEQVGVCGKTGRVFVVPPACFLRDTALPLSTVLHVERPLQHQISVKFSTPCGGIEAFVIS